MIYILTSTSTLLKTEVRPQVSNVDDSVAEGLLHLKLKQQLTSQAFNDQQSYLSVAAIAAYVSLNKLDQRQRYRASLNLLPVESESFNFTQGSSSSGLGYALSLFESWWKVALKHSGEFKYPLFVTGEILTSGQVKGISHLEDKIESACKYVKENEDTISNFYLCYPEENDAEITKEQREQVKKQGGILLPVSRLQSLLGELLGDMYDGDPLGRWAPFKGLNSFNYEDSVRFFGRDKDIERLYDDLNQNDGLLIVTGASGTGKSSLIKAGLIPLLEQKNEAFYWSYTTPSMEVSKEGVIGFIFEQLDVAWGLRDKGIDVQELILTFRHSIDDGIEKLLSLTPERTRKCLLYLDQYEEVFNETDQSIDDITFELTLIDELARQLKPLMIVLALRNEYLGRLLDNQALSSPIITNIPSQLSPDAWHDIIYEQAAFSGVSFERDKQGTKLDSVILSDAVKTPHALPMVEFLLEQLYLKAQDDEQRSNLLQFLHYEQLGGLSGAIAYRATQVLKDNDADSKLVAQLFERFVGLNGESLPYARSVNLVRLSSTEPVLYQLVQDFINANIIVSVVNNDNGHLVRLAHDSLFSNWTTLKKWLDSSKEYLLWRYSIDGQYNRWKTARFNEDDSKEYLLKDKDLLRDGRLFLRDEIIKDVALERYIKESKNNKIKSWSSLFLLFIFLPLMLVALYQWDQNRIKSYYFSAVGEKWSVPFGINELTAEQVSQRRYSYRFDYQGGILKYLYYQNSQGELIANEEKDNVSMWEYKYTKQGGLLSVVKKSDKKKLIRLDQYQFGKNKSVVSFGKELGRVVSLSSSLSALSPYLKTAEQKKGKSTVTREVLSYNEKGYLIRRDYQNPFGGKVSDIVNSYGKSYEYNDLGLPITTFNLDENGEYLITKGVVEVKLRYDGNGNLLERSYYGNNGKLKNIETQYAKLIMKYDLYGNEIETAFYGESNEPVLHKEGFHKFKMKYDEQGSLIEDSYYGTNNSPILRKQGVFKVMYKHDYRGLEVERIHYGLNNEAVITKDDVGISKVTMKYDENRNLIELIYYGVDGLMMLTNDGVAKFTIKYDEYGNRLKIFYFGVDDKPAIHSEGMASMSYRYDENSNVSEEVCFGVDGKPTLNTDNVAIARYKYDEHSNRVEETLFGINAEPILSKIGVHKVISKYDDRGNLIAFESYGVDDKLTFSSINGAAKITYKYNEKGQQIEEAYYDANNKLIADKSGRAKVILQHNSITGEVIGFHTLGSDNKPANDLYGIHRAVVDEKQATVTFYNLAGDSFNESNSSLINAISKYPSKKLGYYEGENKKGDTFISSSFENNNKAQVLEGRSVIFLHPGTLLATISFVKREADKIFVLTDTNAECRIEDKVEKVKILVNSKEYVFYRACLKTNMVAYTVSSTAYLDYDSILSEVFEKEYVEINYGDNEFKFLTKGAIKEYVTTMMRPSHSL